MAAYPSDVWRRCNAWLDASGRWIPAEQLRWWVTDRRTIRGLFPKIRQATADLTMVRHDFPIALTFLELKDLAAAMTYRANGQTNAYYITQPPWLTTLAHGLLRLGQTDSGKRTTIKAEHPDISVARRLLTASWRSSRSLGVVPILDNEPAGPEVQRKALWIDGGFVVVGKSTEYYDELVDALSAQFSDPVVRAAAVACVERTPAWISDYLETRFDLRNEEALPTQRGPEARCLGRSQNHQAETHRVRSSQ